ncbi:MAG: hypothetical protein J6S51_01315 [Kiritimatiellae bacterium]|nr:hypothetical protein [Kiritimatiellia bacterium]
MFLLKVHPRHLLRDIGGGVFLSCASFNAQAILGLQTNYFITDIFGICASIDYRIGDEAKFKKYGEKVGELDMDGWYAGMGVIMQF